MVWTPLDDEFFIVKDAGVKYINASLFCFWLITDGSPL